MIYIFKMDVYKKLIKCTGFQWDDGNAGKTSDLISLLANCNTLFHRSEGDLTGYFRNDYF